MVPFGGLSCCSLKILEKSPRVGSRHSRREVLLQVFRRAVKKSAEEILLKQVALSYSNSLHWLLNLNIVFTNESII